MRTRLNEVPRHSEWRAGTVVRCKARFRNFVMAVDQIWTGSVGTTCFVWSLARVWLRPHGLSQAILMSAFYCRLVKRANWHYHARLLRRVYSQSVSSKLTPCLGGIRPSNTALAWISSVSFSLRKRPIAQTSERSVKGSGGVSSFDHVIVFVRQ